MSSDDFLGKQSGISGTFDEHLGEHAREDGLDVLVRDRHALGAVHVLHFVEHVGEDDFFAANTQDLLRVERAFGQWIARLHPVTRVHEQVLALRHVVIDLLAHIGDDADGHLVLADVVMQFDGAGDSGHDGRILGDPRLEDLRHTGETAGDVRRAGDVLGLPCEHFALLDLVPFRHFDAALGREVVEIENVAVLVLDQDLRVHLAGMLDDDHFVLLGSLRGLHANRLADFDVPETDNARFLGQDRREVRIPLDQCLPLLDGVAVGEVDDAAIGHLVLLEFASTLIQDGAFALSLEGDEAIGPFDIYGDFAALAKLYGAAMGGAVGGLGQAA